jgi:uncharacterized RDD family membrane protein YckC
MGVSEEAIRVPAGLTTSGLLGARYMARIIDSLLLTLLLLAALQLAGTPKDLMVSGLAGPHFSFFSLLLILIFWVGYGAAFESSPWQATLGKRLMGLRVYNWQAGRPAPLQALGRNLVKDGPFIVLAFTPGGRLLSLIWLGGHLAVLYRSPVHQAIHDHFMQTWVAAPEGTTQLHLS